MGSAHTPYSRSGGTMWPTLHTARRRRPRPCYLPREVRPMNTAMRRVLGLIAALMGVAVVAAVIVTLRAPATAHCAAVAGFAAAAAGLDFA